MNNGKQKFSGEYDGCTELRKYNNYGKGLSCFALVQTVFSAAERAGVCVIKFLSPSVCPYYQWLRLEGQCLPALTVKIEGQSF